MADDRSKVPITQELSVAARGVLRACNGRQCKSVEELAPGGVAHIITVQTVTRRKKRARFSEGVEEYIETSPTGLPILRWFLTFDEPRAVWRFVQEMEQRFPDHGFFVQDRIRFPIMKREDYPELNEAFIAEIARVKAVAVRDDRVQIHAKHVIARISCGYLHDSEPVSVGPAPDVVSGMLFAFPTLQSVSDFMTALKSIYHGNITLRVEIDQTPNLRPIARQLGKAPASGGGAGMPAWARRFKIWGGGEAREAPFMAAG